jgi:hypothetical protein
MASESNPEQLRQDRSDELMDGGLDEIREILFGREQRALEHRMSRADAHFSSRSRDIEEDVRRRIEILETHVKRDAEALASRLETQREWISKLEQQLAKAEESAARAQREQRHQMLEQAKAFLDEIGQLRKEFSAALQQEWPLGEHFPAEAEHEAGTASRH